MVWSWGIDFDLAILADAHRDYGIDLPWPYHCQRDARTLCKQLGVDREGDVQHRALADAQQEADAVMKALVMARALREASQRDFPQPKGGSA